MDLSRILKHYDSQSCYNAVSANHVIWKSHYNRLGFNHTNQTNRHKKFGIFKNHLYRVIWRPRQDKLQIIFIKLKSAIPMIDEKLNKN